MADLGAKWKMLSGKNDWNGLLEPLDESLRRYLINYGFLVSAASDAFNTVKQSPAYGMSRFPKDENYFSNVGVEKSIPFKYQVTDFLYGRSEINFGDAILAGQSAYFGYVAVNTDESKILAGRREIVICYRLTSLFIEWFKDFDMAFTSASDLFPNTNALCHRGFHSIYTSSNANSTYNKMSLRQQVQAAVRRLLDKYVKRGETVSITVAGHSVGSTLATLTAMDLAYNGYNKATGSNIPVPITAFCFAPPRVGNNDFKKVFDTLRNAGSVHLLRIRNNGDIFPGIPTIYLTIPYAEVGNELYLDATKAPDLKGFGMGQAHDLNLHLYAIAGYHSNGPFKLVVNLDISIVNKNFDLLKDSFNIPPKWWSNVYRLGMVQGSDGSWKLNDHVPPPPEEVEAAAAAANK